MVHCLMLRPEIVLQAVKIGFVIALLQLPWCSVICEGITTVCYSNSGFSTFFLIPFGFNSVQGAGRRTAVRGTRRRPFILLDYIKTVIYCCELCGLFGFGLMTLLYR